MCLSFSHGAWKGYYSLINIYVELRGCYSLKFCLITDPITCNSNDVNDVMSNPMFSALCYFPLMASALLEVPLTSTASGTVSVNQRNVTPLVFKSHSINGWKLCRLTFAIKVNLSQHINLVLFQS